LFDLTLIPLAWVLGFVFALSTSSDHGVIVGGSQKVVIAHTIATSKELWLKEMPGDVWTVRIHGSVVVVPVDNSKTVVLDVTTGHQLHALPSAGERVYGICLFDGLTSVVIYFLFDFITVLLS
jgi:hypothetical protein